MYRARSPASAFAQKPAAEKNPGDFLLKARYSRTADEAFQAVVELAAGINEEATDVERMQLFVKAGAWDKVAELLREYDPDVAHRIYMRIVYELIGGNPKAVMLPLDVVRLADAAPVAIDKSQAGPLGRMLFVALQGTESRAELMVILKKGTPRLGGTDPETRRAAASLLASAELWAEAKEFGLKDADIPRGVIAGRNRARRPSTTTLGSSSYRSCTSRRRKTPNGQRPWIVSTKP